MRKYLPSIVFNLAEIAIIILIGIGLNIEYSHVSYILLVFFIARLAVGKPKHYKAWQKCLVWSTLIFLSLFVLAKTNLVISVLMAVFCALILSNRANINDLFQWKPAGQSNYQILIDYIKFNGLTDEMLEAESLLKKRVTAQEYALYKRIIVDGSGKSSAWDGAEAEFDVHREKIKQALDKCYCYMIGRLNI